MDARMIYEFISSYIIIRTPSWTQRYGRDVCRIDIPRSFTSICMLSSDRDSESRRRFLSNETGLLVFFDWTEFGPVTILIALR